MELTERLVHSLDWTTYLLVASFVLLAVARHLFPRRFMDLLVLPVSIKFLRSHGKDDELQHPFNILFFIFQVINGSIFLRLLIDSVQDKDVHGLAYTLQIITLYTVFVLSKVIIEKIVGHLFSIDQVIQKYLYEKLAYRNLLSILMFIGNLFFLYAIDLGPLAVWLFGLLILFLNFIALITIYKRNWNLITPHFSYFILYLCTLEISPYIILYKLYY